MVVFACMPWYRLDTNIFNGINLYAWVIICSKGLYHLFHSVDDGLDESTNPFTYVTGEIPVDPN